MREHKNFGTEMQVGMTALCEKTGWHTKKCMD